MNVDDDGASAMPSDAAATVSLTFTAISIQFRLLQVVDGDNALHESQERPSTAISSVARRPWLDYWTGCRIPPANIVPENFVRSRSREPSAF